MANSSIIRFVSIGTVFFSLIAGFGLGTTKASAPASGLVGYWKFDEGSGTTTADSAGSNTGAVSGATWSAGKINGALSFDGNDSVTAGSVSLGTSFTVSAWVSFSSNQIEAQVIAGVGRNRALYMYNRTTYFFDGAAERRFGTAVSSGTWHNVAIVYNGSSFQAYLDGQINGAAQNASLPSYSGNVNMGAWFDGTYKFVGSIDEVRIYNRALSASEIFDIYNGTGSMPPLNDTTPPTIAVGSPVNGAVVAGASVAVSASALDNVGIVGVRFLLDGQILGTEDLTSPYSVTWNTTQSANGSHTLSAVARDAAGNTASSSPVSVTADNQAPLGSVVINNGNAATNNRNSILGLSATDAHSQVTQMRFSNTGTSYSAAEAFAASKAWTLTTGSGTKTVYVQFKDAAGNWSAAITDTIILDTTKPTVSNRSVSNISNSTATVNWTTNEPATSQVEYGLSTSYGGITLLDTNLTTAHNVLVNGLAPQTTYQYRIRTKDAAGNETISSNGSFTTLAGPDLTPPTVAITYPTESQTVSGLINVTASASDNVSVAGVKFFVDGSILGNEDLAYPYGTVWDSAQFPSGSHILLAVARDAAGNTSTSSPVRVNVYTDTTPPSAPINLTATPVASYRIDLAWSASTDDLSVAGYKIFRDASLIATTSQTSFQDTGLNASTTYTYTVLAFDAAGNASAESGSAQATTLPGQSSVNWPLRISPNGRYLEDQSGSPFTIVGEAAWQLTTQISHEDAMFYLDDRKSKGFNGIETLAINHLIQTNRPNNYYNEPPFTRGPADWSVRNEAYWSRIDSILTEMKNRGMVAIMFPAYLGYGCGEEGWCQQMLAQTDSAVFNYGQWIGNRYKDYGNVIWMTGGDFDVAGTDVESKNAAIVNGIRSVDSNALFSVEPVRWQIGGIDSYVNLVDINAVYVGDAQTMMKTAYTNSTRPFMLQEGDFENEHGTSVVTQQSQALTTYLGGGLVGYIFGACPTWSFLELPQCDSHVAPFDTWQNSMNSPGSISIGNIGKLMHSRKWWALVPDYANTVVTSYKGSGIGYQATAREANGDSVIVWSPDSNQTTVNMSKIGGTQARVWWFDVNTGTSVLVGTFPTTGTRSFTPSGSQKVLVLDNDSLNLPAPGTTVFNSVP